VPLEELPAAVYERAERLLEPYREALVPGLTVEPHWIGDGSTLWYRSDGPDGDRYVIADPERGTRTEQADRPEPLPTRAEVLEARSPDGRWAAVLDGFDLVLRATGSGEEVRVTDDGTAERRYAAYPDASVALTFLTRYAEGRSAPVVLWSPDSRRILFHVTDQRDVELMHLVESAPEDGSRPRLHSYPYAMPHDEAVPHGEWRIYDIETRELTAAQRDPFGLPFRSPLRFGTAWWSADGATAYHLESPRYLQELRLVAIDAATGEARVLLTETGETRVEGAQAAMGMHPNVRVLAGGREAIWYSQRDGWPRLYLYDLETGQEIRRLTEGAVAVDRILAVDEDDRAVYLTVTGLDDDPYLRSLVRVGLDDGVLTRLTDDGLDHAITAAPHGRWFVDSASTVATPPVTTVRGRNGEVIQELERADASRLTAAGWTPPERFRATAADGVTPIYGVLHLPPDFDPSRSYPVVDHTYPGPQSVRVSPAFANPKCYTPDAEAVAALGFVVVAIDGRGTPGRDKAFHDASYRRMGDAGGQDDHVAAIRELAATRPWMDLDRVGMFGHSGGGFATVRAMLRFPDFYRVGVAESGNHDNRFYYQVWAETYDGPPHPDQDRSLSNVLLADNLVGKLLLVHGDMDENVTPHLTMRLVDRLVAADKDFDLVIVPGAEHTFFGYEHYVTRRRWDFLVRHLLGVAPPAYRIAPFPVSEREIVEHLQALA
jgi:dipeptidyl aminopeptidase/acylaminoacyl peptidase